MNAIDDNIPLADAPEPKANVLCSCAVMQLATHPVVGAPMMVIRRPKCVIHGENGLAKALSGSNLLQDVLQRFQERFLPPEEPEEASGAESE
jgi:hypothetical protein